MTSSRYYIKKLIPKDIAITYLKTINHSSTKRFILYSKKSSKKITKEDLKEYLKNLKKNDFIYGIFNKKKKHVANFKITVLKTKAYIGFLVFLKYRGKGIIKAIFPKILKLKLLKENKIRYIFLGVDKKNKNAIKLYKNIGFLYKDSNKIMYYKI